MVKESWADKLSKKLPKFNISQEALTMYINGMFIIAVLGCIPLATQCYKVYSTKECAGISKYAFMFQMFLSASWIVYGLLTRNAILILSSSLVLTAAGILVYLINSNS